MPDLPNVVAGSIRAFLVLVILVAVSFGSHGDEGELGSWVG